MTGGVGREKRLDLSFKRITLIAFRGITVGWVGEETGKYHLADHAMIM